MLPCWQPARGMEHTQTLEGPLGFRKRLSPFTCPPGSGGNVLVCLGLVLLTCFLGLSFAETEHPHSPTPIGLMERGGRTAD